MNQPSETKTDSPSAPALEPSGDKKPYCVPVLKRWGTVTDITQGALNGTEDFPGQGGTGGA